MARGDDCRIPASSQKVQGAVAEHVSPAEKGLPLLIGHDGYLAAAHGDADVPRFGKGPAGHPVSLVGVSGHEKPPAEHVPEKTDIVDALVSLAVLAHVQAYVGQHKFQAGVVDVVKPVLVVCLCKTEYPEIGPKARYTADRGCTCSCRRGVLLDPGLDEPFGAGFGKTFYLDGARQVAVEYKYGCSVWVPVVEPADVFKGVPETGPVVGLFVGIVCPGFTGLYRGDRRIGLEGLTKAPELRFMRALSSSSGDAPSSFMASM